MISRPRTRSVYTKLFEKEEEVRRCLQIDVLLPVARFVTLLLDLLAMIYDGRLHLRFPANLFRLVRRCKLDDMMHRFLQTIERNSSFFGKRNGQIFMFKIFDINLKFQI